MCKRIKHGLQIILVGNIQQAKQPLKTPTPQFNSAGWFPERTKIRIKMAAVTTWLKSNHSLAWDTCKMRAGLQGCSCHFDFLESLLWKHQIQCTNANTLSSAIYFQKWCDKFITFLVAKINKYYNYEQRPMRFQNPEGFLNKKQKRPDHGWHPNSMNSNKKKNNSHVMTRYLTWIWQVAFSSRKFESAASFLIFFFKWKSKGSRDAYQTSQKKFIQYRTLRASILLCHVWSHLSFINCDTTHQYFAKTNKWNRNFTSKWASSPTYVNWMLKCRCMLFFVKLSRTGVLQAWQL